MDLSNSYNSVIVGKSYVSIAFAILQKTRLGIDNLVLDDETFQLGDKWNTNIGELEKKTLQKLGQIYNIEPLARIDQFIEQNNTLIFLNEKMIELGSSPFSNIKELARKLPQCFSNEFIESLEQIVPESFDAQVDGFFNKVAVDSVDEKKLDEKRLFLGESEPLESVFKRFLKYFESDQLVTNQLHYILQALFQTLISNVLSETESRYLLAAILSPRYRIDTKRLEEELMFSYKSMGGKSKKAKIQRFEIYKNSLEYILLDSFEGAIKTDKVYLFGHFEQGPQFEYRHESTLYKSITVSCPLDHKFAERFVGKRIIFSSADRMGTDFPHWEVVIDEKHVARAFYVYANYEGAKPSFYYKKASDDLYHSLNTVFPGLDQTDWESQIEFNKGHDVWLEKIEEKVDSKRQAIKSELGGQCYQNGVPVKKLVYCGPLRSRFLGLFGYLLNIFNH